MKCWTIATSVRLAPTMGSHGWVRLAPWYWDETTGRLSRPESVAGAIGRLGVRQADGGLEASWDGVASDDAAIRSLDGRIRRWLCLDWDPTPFVALASGLEPALAVLVEEGGGRMLRASTFHEDFVKTVLTVNTNWGSTCRMAAILTSEIGNGVFPGPDAILAFGAEGLARICRLGYRAPYLIAALDRLRTDGVLDAAGNADESLLTYPYLLGLRGIGPYAAAHCRMLLGDFSRLPIDTEMVAHLASLGLTAKSAAGHLESWGPWGLLAVRLRRQHARTLAPTPDP